MPPSSTYSLRIRAEIQSEIGLFGKVMASIGDAGGEVGGVDIVRSAKTSVTRDITVLASDEAHGERISAALDAMDGVSVIGVSDRVFLSHAGGKIGMQNRVALEGRDDLSMAYTPGVARVCMAINADFDRAWDLTIKGNSVMVVSDGSSVVGQGDLGPEAALPAMEAKCMFLRRFADIDAFPLPVTVRDPDEISKVVRLCSSVFAGIHLTDIAAPRCFDVISTLGPQIDVPVFQDDQEGTAAALLAALLNGLKVAGKTLGDSRIVVAGLGPGGVATIKLLVAAGAGEVLACDREGAVHAGRSGMDAQRSWIAENTNPDGRTGTAQELLRGADAFVGLSVPHLLDRDDLRSMARNPVVFALAMPEPEISLGDAGTAVKVYGSGRPDVPNQIHSALAYPGIWRGALDCRATRIDDAMVMAAARAIAETVGEESLAPEYVVPSVFNRQLAENVATAVREAAEASGAARLHAAL